MILGIGHDLCDVRRVEKVLKKFKSKFINKICTSEEINLSKRIIDKNNFYAMRFSVKEAFYKSLPSPIQKYCSWHDIELFKSKIGKPEIKMNSKIENHLWEYFKCSSIPIVHVSLSNEYPYVSSYVCISC